MKSLLNARRILEGLKLIVGALPNNSEAFFKLTHAEAYLRRQQRCLETGYLYGEFFPDLIRSERDQ